MSDALVTTIEKLTKRLNEVEAKRDEALETAMLLRERLVHLHQIAQRESIVYGDINGMPFRITERILDDTAGLTAPIRSEDE